MQFRKAHFKFMLDRGVSHLLDCLARKRVVTTATLGLRSNLSDDEFVEYASERGYLSVASNRRDFLPDAKHHVAQSSKKQFGCCRIPGMILLVPNEEIVQRRVLKGIESRLTFKGKPASHEVILILNQPAGNVTTRCHHLQPGTSPD